jgi:hypothetical protein
LELPAELRRERIIVFRHQRASEEREIVGRKHMDGPADDMRHDQITVVDGLVIYLAREPIPTRRQRQQTRVTREIRGRARRRLGKSRCVPAGQPQPSQPKG